MKKVYRALNCFEPALVFISAGRGCVSTSAFASLVGVSVGTVNSAVGIKICVITAGRKRKRKKHDKIVLLAKTK